MKILITGSSSGIGEEVARVLLDQGHVVLGVARTAAKWQLLDKRFIFYQTDFKLIDQSAQIFDKIIKDHKDVDILFINAGYGEFKSLEQFSDKQVIECFNVNFLTQILLVKRILPYLKRLGNKKIIFMGSSAANNGANKGSIYCASKFALKGFCQSLRKEALHNNISVTIINPDMVNSNFYQEHNFTYGDSADNYITTQQVNEIVQLILRFDNNINIDEINLSPMKKVIKSK